MPPSVLRPGKKELLQCMSSPARQARQSPLALDQVQVGAAQPGSTDLDDHVVGAGDSRLLDLVDRRTLLVLAQPDCSHRRSPHPVAGFSLPNQASLNKSLAWDSDCRPLSRRALGTAHDRTSTKISKIVGIEGRFGATPAANRQRNGSNA